MRKSLKVKTLFMASLAAVSLCSCGKEDTSWRDALLNDVSGEYYLVGYDWQGAPVDINGDGKVTGVLLPGLLDIMGSYGARDFTLKVDVTSDMFWEGYAAGHLPCVVKSYRDGYRPDGWGGSYLSFNYGINKDGLCFSNERISDKSDDDREILTRLSEPRVEFTRDHRGDEIRYLTVNCVAKVYDQSTNRYVDGTVALRYVTSPRVKVDDWVVTVSGATADGMVTYAYDLRTGK